jgi:hypothetical protein
VGLGIELLAAADRYMVEGLKEQCEYLLHQRIALENAFQIHTAAKLYSAPQLINSSAHFILMNYEHISFGDEDRTVLLGILDLIK